jgi:NAD(P)-dependent dehydrogenase (short-subunit alcohol dehydrogenase family)
MMLGMPAPPVACLLDLTGRIALVTGSGSGLGRGIAARLAEAGAAVAVHYRRSRAGADEVAGRIREAGGRAVAIEADLAEPEGATRLVASTLEALGRLDILVNNAGVYPLAGMLEMTAAEWDEVLAANLRAAFTCTQAAGREMARQGTGGAIVNVTSIEAERPLPGHGHYAAAKAGVAAFTRAAARELAPHGIRVNAVAPGLIGREGIEEQWPEGVARWRTAAPLGRLGAPEDVADACLFLVSAGARWITGATLTVDGGVTAAPPF